MTITIFFSWSFKLIPFRFRYKYPFCSVDEEESGKASLVASFFGGGGGGPAGRKLSSGSVKVSDFLSSFYTGSIRQLKRENG